MRNARLVKEGSIWQAGNHDDVRGTGKAVAGGMAAGLVGP